MPLAGQIIRAIDFTPSVENDDPTNVSGITSTTYVAGSPECGVTVMAPTSGVVNVMVAASLDPDGSNLLFVSFEVREDDSSGTVVMEAHDDRSVATQVAGIELQSTSKRVDGLEAGREYYIRTMHRVNGGAGQLFFRRITAIPTT